MGTRNPLKDKSGWGRLTLAHGLLAWLAAGTPLVRAAEEVASAILPVTRPAAGVSVEFARDVLPVLRANCLPCHNKTTSKAELLLETPAEMLKGGESGPALIIGKPLESLLFRVSTHEEKPKMPPKENKVNARALTPTELGLLAAWIEQGAQVSGRTEETIQWESLPSTVQSIAAVSVTADGRWAACGRGNRLAVYDLGLGALVADLTEGSLGVAHRDTVNAVAFSADGEWLASGGFREVKLWRRTPTETPETTEFRPPLSQPPAATVLTNAGLKRLVFFGGTEPARLTDLTGTNVLAKLPADRTATFALAEAQRRFGLAKGELTQLQTQADVARKDAPKTAERRQKATEALLIANGAVIEKQAALAKVEAARNAAEFAMLRAERAGDTNQIKTANEKLETARKATEPPEKELKQATNKQGSAEEESRLAELAFTRASLLISGAEAALRRAEMALASAEAEATEQAVLTRQAESPVTFAEFNNSLLLTGHADGSIRTWNPATGAALDVFRAGHAALAERPTQAVSKGATTHPARPIGEITSTLARHRPRWTLVRTLGQETNSLFSDRVNALAFRPDGQRLAIGGGEPSRGGDLHIIEPASGELRYAFTNLHSDSVLAVAWSPDGRWLATSGADRFARLVDTAAARPERIFEGHTGHVLAVAWSPDGRTLATGGAESTLKFWDVFSGEKRKQIQASGKEFTGVAFINEDQVVGCTGDPVVSVWKRGGEHVRDYEKPSDYQLALAATPDGQTVVAGGLNGVLRVWRGTEAKPVWSLGLAPTSIAKAASAKK